MGFCSCNSLHNVYMSIIPQEHLFTMQYYPTDFFYSTNANDMPNGFEGCTILSEETENIVCNKSKNYESNLVFKFKPVIRFKSK